MLERSSFGRLGETLAGLLSFFILLLLWQWGVATGLLPGLAIPEPRGVAFAGIELLAGSVFWENWRKTLSLWSAALAVTLIVGLGIGLAIGTSRFVRSFLMPPLSYFRSIPPIALFPIALVAMGPGDLSISVVAAMTAILYVVPGTAAGAGETASRYDDLRATLDISTIDWFRHFLLPGALYQVLAAVRVAATAAFAVVIAGEIVIGGFQGVGAAILDHSEQFHLEEAYWYVASTGLIGLGIDSLFGRLERRIPVEIS